MPIKVDASRKRWYDLMQALQENLYKGGNTFLSEAGKIPPLGPIGVVAGAGRGAKGIAKFVEQVGKKSGLGEALDDLTVSVAKFSEPSSWGRYYKGPKSAYISENLSSRTHKGLTALHEAGHHLTGGDYARDNPYTRLLSHELLSSQGPNALVPSSSSYSTWEKVGPEMLSEGLTRVLMSRASPKKFPSPLVDIPGAQPDAFKLLLRSRSEDPRILRALEDTLTAVLSRVDPELILGSVPRH